MDLALLILSILSCLASALCFIWNECMWFIRFNVAFCVARASFLKIYFPVKQSNKNKDWSTWSVLLEPCVAFPWVVCPFVPVCRCSPSRSPRGGWRTSPRSPPGPSSPHCRASAASWSWWRPRAPCHSSRWGSRHTSPLYDPDPRRSVLQLPEENTKIIIAGFKISSWTTIDNADLSLLPGLIGDLNELLDLRYGRSGEVLHRYHRVL